MKELKLSLTHYKVLHTVSLLNDLSLYPTQEGIYKILSGRVDDETKDLTSLPTFGVIISYSSKKICHYVLALLRYGYIKNVFDPITEELYLQIAPLGITSLNAFLAKRKWNYSKTKRVEKPSIVKITKK